MSSRKENSFKKAGARLLSMFQGDNTAKVFFLLLSVFLWLLINLSKEGFSASISYPVNYEQAPEGYRLVNNPPANLQVVLKGRGFDIIKSRLRSWDPLAIPLSEVSLNDTGAYILNTVDHQSLISSELGDNLNITQISPARIGLKFSRIKQKKFKVHLNYKKNFSKFKSLYRTPVIRPDSISIWGTESELAKIDSVGTKLLKLNGEEDSVSLMVELDLPESNQLEFSHKSVKVKLSFTSLTEGTLEIPVRIRNVPADYSVTIIPKRVRLTYQVAINDFAKIEAEDFDCYVDLRNLDANPEFLIVKLNTLPALIRNYSIDPVRVEYILTK